MGCNHSIDATNNYKTFDCQSTPPSPAVYSTASARTYVFDHGDIPDNFTVPEIQVIMNNNPSALSQGW